MACGAVSGREEIPGNGTPRLRKTGWSGNGLVIRGRVQVLEWSFSQGGTRRFDPGHNQAGVSESNSGARTERFVE